MKEAAACGGVLGLSGLDHLTVRSASSSLLVALRPDAVLMAELDGKVPVALESALEHWLVTTPELGWDDEAPTAAGVEPESVSVFGGRLGVFSVPDLLDFLRNGRRTGELVLTRKPKVSRVLFQNGWVTHAQAPGTPGLIPLLVSGGELSSVDGAALEQRIAGDRDAILTASSLVAQSLLSKEGLERALERQLSLTIKEIMHWKEGEFAFSREVANERALVETAVSVDPQAVLLELFREEDEGAPRAG